MKKIYFIVATLIMAFQISNAGTFEIRTTNKGSGIIGVEMRETSGTGTPSTSNSVTDIKFGIKWLASYGVDLNSSITTDYHIEKSGTRTVSGSYH